MANGVGFEGANHVFQAPPGDTNCVDLETFTDGTQVISCWRLSEEELAEVARTGVVWLSVRGRALPPVLVSGQALVSIVDHPAQAEPLLPKKPVMDRVKGGGGD